MRIAATAVLSATIVGAAITPGWCPEPANLGGYMGGSTGATGEARPPKPTGRSILRESGRAPYNRNSAMDRLGGGRSIRP